MSRSRAARRPVCCPSRRPGFASPLHVACAAAQASRHCRVLPELPPRPRVTAVCCARAAAWASRHRRMLPPQPAARATLRLETVGYTRSSYVQPRPPPPYAYPLPVCRAQRSTAYPLPWARLCGQAVTAGSGRTVALADKRSGRARDKPPRGRTSDRAS